MQEERDRMGCISWHFMRVSQTRRHCACITRRRYLLEYCIADQDYVSFVSEAIFYLAFAGYVQHIYYFTLQHVTISNPDFDKCTSLE
jgi:hypothetical protein